MPLDHYGFVAGTFDRFDPDDRVRYGNPDQGHLFVTAPPPGGGTLVPYRCAVDVKMPEGAVEYVKLSVPRRAVAGILHQVSGYHDLARLPESGAVDYVRSPYIRKSLGYVSLACALLYPVTLKKRSVWAQNVDSSALADLESILLNVHRVYVFGQQFYNALDNGHGMHDVHMNQGNGLPVSGAPDYEKKLAWYRSDGAWQDGGVIVEHDDGSVEGFFLKFLSQTLDTSDNGRPRPAQRKPVRGQDTIRTA